MAIIPKLETASFHECSEQLDGQKKWVENIDLSKDSGTWRDSIDLPADMGNSAPSVEKADLDLSRFEESKQVERMVDYLDRLPEVKRENWLNLSFEDRVRAVQKIETQAAKVGCRPALTVKAESMSSGNLGYMDWQTQKIAINEDLLMSNKPEDFRQVIKTILHEGRHAYQFSNVSLERTEPNNEKYQAWTLNYVTGYCAARLFGLKKYYLQPVEVDARVFSESIVSRLKV